MGLEMHCAIETAISSMDPGRAAGPDGISPPLLQIKPVLLGRYMVALWKACGRIQCMPANLTMGRVTQVFKKGELRLPQNYRRITVLNVARRVISSALDTLLRRELVFHECQWGFGKRWPQNTLLPISLPDARKGTATSLS